MVGKTQDMIVKIDCWILNSIGNGKSVWTEYALLQKCESVLGSGTSMMILPSGKMAQLIVDTILSATDIHDDDQIISYFTSNNVSKSCCSMITQEG